MTEMGRNIESVSILCAAKIKQFEANLFTIQEKIKIYEDSPETASAVENLKKVLDAWLAYTDECISSFQDTMSVLNPSISWHKKKDMLEMFFLSGDNPWSFWLTYNLPDIETVLKDIETRWRRGLLCKIDKLEPQGFVCCCDAKSCFRGFIITVLSKTWVRILNVDKGQIKLAKIESCYELPKEFCEPHANAIQCCLIKDEFSETKWNPDLTELFQTTLKESRLTVRILEKLDTNPPKFVIELYAFNESSEAETSISHWVSSRLLPILEELDSEMGKGNYYEYLDDDVLDPFCISTLCVNNSFTDSDSNEMPNFKGDTNEAAEKPLEATYKFNVSDITNSPNEKPRNRLAHIINTEKEKNSQKLIEKEEKSPIAQKSTMDGLSKNKFLFENAINAPEFKPNSSYCSATDPDAFLHCSVKAEVINSSSRSDGILDDLDVSNNLNLPDDHILCPSFAKDGYCWKPSCQKEHKLTTVMDPESITSGDYEKSAFPGNYNPTDDQRICTFFARNGYCWKTSCQKEHTKPAPDKWTNDSDELFKESFNKLSLPPIGTKSTVTVTHVLSATSFYVILPSISGTEDDDETIESLNDQLHHLSVINEFKMLSSPPCFGQLVVAFSAKKNQWLRASVFDLYDNDMILVNFVDFGLTEEVKLENCREILPQHIHLPYQAVYCSLSGLYVEKCQDKVGKKYLEQFILDKEIKVEIIDSDVHDTRIEVIAYSSGLNLNEVMVKNGYCSIFQR